MTGGVYSMASARARIVTPSWPSVAKNSSAASRIFSRTSERSRCFRSLTPIKQLLPVTPLQYLTALAKSRAKLFRAHGRVGQTDAGDVLAVANGQYRAPRPAQVYLHHGVGRIAGGAPPLWSRMIAER